MSYKILNRVKFCSVDEMLAADQTKQELFSGRHPTQGQVLLHQDDLTPELINLQKS
jgi:hypothetical protein